MRRFLFLVVNLFIIIPLLFSCSKEDNIIDTIIVKQDTIIKNDTIIKIDTIISDTDTIIIPDTIINSDTTIISDTTIQPNNITNSEIPLADPFILLYEDKYYAYGTYTANTGFQVYSSDDLLNWKLEGMALIKENTTVTDRFWAPEVYWYNNQFYMFFCGDHHIHVATSTSPKGPFVQQKSILIKDAIDPTVFWENDSTAYMFYQLGWSLWRTNISDSLTIYNKKTLEFNQKVQDWWEFDPINEGPTVIKHKDWYYLVYSANFMTNQNYAIGVAVSKNIEGKWEKVSYNPILKKPFNLLGTGHSSIFTDKDGNLCIVFHAHNNKNSIHPRKTYIAKIRFKESDYIDGADTLIVDKNSIISLKLKE